jgi:polyhydroxyalkanoate synthesis regulator phasin
MATKKLVLLSGAVITGLMVTVVGGSALAKSTNTQQFKGGKGIHRFTRNEKVKFDSTKIQENFKSELAKLITDKTITQEQSEKVLASLAKVPEVKGKGGIQELVINGAITQAEADAVMQALRKVEPTRVKPNQATMEAERTKRFAEVKTAIAGLVSNNKLTQEKADKIIAAISAQDSEKGWGRRGMGGPLQSLVKSGTITKADVETVMNEIPKPTMKRQDQAAKETERTKRLADMKTAISGLVSAGALSQEKANKIIAACTELSAKKADQIKGPFSELVTSGVLTQNQADAIAKALFKGGPGPRYGHR